MVRTILLFAIIAGVSFCGCHKNEEEIPQTSSVVKFKGSNVGEAALGDMTNTDPKDSNEDVIFTGNDILWFNGKTNELRFKNNISQAHAHSFLFYQSIKVYINEDQLFSALVFDSNIHARIYNSLVFYYNSIENRFYIKDGYPDISFLGYNSDEQKLRDENMKKIEVEWNRFICQLKQEGRYKE